MSAFLIPMIMSDVPLYGISQQSRCYCRKRSLWGYGNEYSEHCVNREFVFLPIHQKFQVRLLDIIRLQFLATFGIKAHTVDYLANLPMVIAFDSMFDEAAVYCEFIVLMGLSGATPLGLAANGGWSAVQEASYTLSIL